MTYISCVTQVESLLIASFQGGVLSDLILMDGRNTTLDSQDVNTIALTATVTANTLWCFSSRRACRRMVTIYTTALKKNM